MRSGSEAPAGVRVAETDVYTAAMTAPSSATRERLLALFAIVIAGEMIFSLPFHLPRYFRPSWLEAFGVSNTQLGDVFAVYGITAMLAYFPGGALADRFAARQLMAASLAATALGGIYLATFPSPRGLAVLYGYWGVTTIFLFWAAMIRATRQWGGRAEQGRAFGLLDGGRGLAAAAFATVAVSVFAQFVGDDVAVLAASDRRAGMQAVIALYSAVTLAAAVLVWFAVPAREHAPPAPAGTSLTNMVHVLGQARIWMQAVIVVCAYCGYKGLDNYALYAHEVLGLGETQAAAFTATAAYLRPLAAVAAGFIADRYSTGRTIAVLFAVLVGVYAVLAMLEPQPALRTLIYANIVISFAAVFALRGVYFALFEELEVPPRMTGIAVGLVSVVGYTPDIFFAPIAGRLLDAAPGVTGHQHYFWLLAVVALVGFLTAAKLARMNGARRAHEESRS